MNCLTCNYDRTGIDNDKPCPECGAPAPKFHRIARDRAIVRVALRFVILAFAIYFSFLTAAQLLQFYDYIAFSPAATIGIAISLAVVWGAVGVLWRLSAFVADRIVPPQDVWGRHHSADASGPMFVGRWRAIATMAVRTIGVAALCIASTRMVATLGYMVIDRRIRYDGPNAGLTSFDLEAWAVWLSAPLLTGFVTWFFAPTFARMIVPDRLFTRCLSCGVAFDKKNPPETCPECGWVVRAPNASLEVGAAPAKPEIPPPGS